MFRTLDKANAVPRAPAALVPNPAPTGTSIRCLTITLNGESAFCKSFLATAQVVSASEVGFPFISTSVLFFFAGARIISVNTPFSVTKPPPRAPIFRGSLSGFPSSVVSQISKKLEIPEGEKALTFFCTASSLGRCSEARKRLATCL